MKHRFLWSRLGIGAPVHSRLQSRNQRERSPSGKGVPLVYVYIRLAVLNPCNSDLLESERDQHSLVVAASLRMMVLGFDGRVIRVDVHDLRIRKRNFGIRSGDLDFGEDSLLEHGGPDL